MASGPGTTGQTNFGSTTRTAGAALRIAPDRSRRASAAPAGTIRPPFFDVPFWLRQIGLAIDRIIALHARPPLLIGNSVGAALALKTVASRPELQQVLVIGTPVGPACAIPHCGRSGTGSARRRFARRRNAAD